MLAAAAQKIAPWWEKLAFNWFDILLVAVLAFGLWRGRKRGMTREVLPSSHWVALVLVAGLGYAQLGTLLTKSGISKGLLTFMKSFLESSATEHGTAFAFGYLFLALGVSIAFVFIQRAFKAKLEGSNIFGGSEYYLGMGAGAIRYVCMLIAFLAVLNAPVYSPAEIAAKTAYDKKEFGGGLYNGNYFPHVYEVQEAVFKKSLTGPYVKSGLMILLVNTGAGETKPASPH